MKKTNKRLLLMVIIAVIIIAGFLDLKYEGLFYQMLPEFIQSLIG